jgi:hypothetical protein
MNANRFLLTGLMLVTATILSFASISSAKAGETPDLQQQGNLSDRSNRQYKRRSQPSQSETPATSVKIEQSWGGQIDLKLRSLIPDRFYISNQADWAKLWQAYRGGEALPQIDFDREIAIVYALKDPNSMFLNLSLTPTGDLQISASSTLIGYNGHTTCSYQFARIKRDGIKTIKGQPLS